jgi:hypothetical protein
LHWRAAISDELRTQNATGLKPVSSRSAPPARRGPKEAVDVDEQELGLAGKFSYDSEGIGSQLSTNEVNGDEE